MININIIDSSVSFHFYSVNPPTKAQKLESGRARVNGSELNFALLLQTILMQLIRSLFTKSPPGFLKELWFKNLGKEMFA